MCQTRYRKTEQQRMRRAGHGSVRKLQNQVPSAAVLGLQSPRSFSSEVRELMTRPLLWAKRSERKLRALAPATRGSTFPCGRPCALSRACVRRRKAAGARSPREMPSFPLCPGEETAAASTVGARRTSPERAAVVGARPPAARPRGPAHCPSASRAGGAGGGRGGVVSDMEQVFLGLSAVTLCLLKYLPVVFGWFS